MSKLSQDLTLKLSSRDTASACREAVAMIGWKTANTASDSKVVAKFGFGLFSNPGKVEMSFAEVGSETKVLLNASIKQIGPIAEAKLKSQLAQLRGAIEASAMRYANQSTGSLPAQGSPAASGSENEPQSVEQRLAALARMRSESLITDAEYEEQRKRVLDSL
jgi:hypothetical protein